MFFSAMRRKRKYDLLRIELHLWDKIVISFIPVLVLVISGAFCFLVHNFIAGQFDTVERNLTDINYVISLQLDDYVKSKAKILETMAKFPEIYGMNPAAQKKFVDNYANLDGFRNVFFVDNQGISYYPEVNQKKDQSKEPFFFDIKDSEFFITAPYYPSTRSFTTICLPIRDAAGVRKGTICGTIYLNTLQVMMRKYENSTKGTCFVIQPNGNLIVATMSGSTKKQINIFDNTEDDLDVIRDAIETKGKSFGKISFDHKTFFAYASYMPDLDWLFVNFMSLEYVLQNLIATIIIFSVLAVSFVLIFISLIHVLISWGRSNDKIYTDPLCECGSRAACNAMLEALQKHKELRISMIFADLDRFKQVNDTFGHEAGDEMLLVFSRHLKFVFSEYGFIGRNGGDEFIVMVYDLSDEEIVSMWLDLEARLKQASLRLAFDYEIEASRGIESREKGSDEQLAEVLKRADKKMYADKAERKKNRAD